MLRTAPTPAAPARSTTPLERSILLAVLYGDVFDHPLTASEIARYRPAVDRAEASDETFESALDRLLEHHLSRVDDLICWRGREAIVELRRRRQGRAPARWRLAERYAGWLQHVPFVRMAAVCGSQAMENAGEDGDLDFFLITAPGRLWVVHFCVMVLRRVAGVVPEARQRNSVPRVKVCPNYLVTLDSLEVVERDLYTAREIAQAVPLWGEAAYDAFLTANAWIGAYLPHLDPEERRHRLRRSPRSLIQRALELLLVGIVGQAADRILYTLLTRYYSLRWRRHGWTGAELRKAYRRDRQAVIGGGFGRSVADSLRRLVGKKLGAGDGLAGELEADLDRLLPAQARESGGAVEPFQEVFARHYGVVRKGAQEEQRHG